MPAEWYYAKDKQKFGPVEASELKRLATSGSLSPNDLVSKEGQPKWVRASSIKGLFPGNGSVAVAPAPSASQTVPAIRAVQQGTLTETSTNIAALPTKASFSQWYGIKLGKKWWIVQAILWIAYGFIWIPLWWLFTRHKVAPNQLGASSSISADEARRQQELEKLERLQGNGEPFIRGEIVRLKGVSGLAKGECSLLFQQENVVLELATGKRMPVPYDQIKGLQIAGQGKVVESVNNAFVGGGFGLGGALQGAAQAMLLNAAVSALTRNERFECEIAMEWGSGELVMMNREYLPEVVGKVLHPFIEKIPG
ncbi:MAG: DUF4339 domain-containing protein [Planctomycetia bacterium]